MITFLYAGILGLLFIALSLNVIFNRARKRVLLLDGGDKEMLGIIRAHGNFAEYAPFALLLIYMTENSGGIYTTHVAGILLLLGRIIHAYGILKLEHPSKAKKSIKGRQAGMVMTFSSIGICSIYLLTTYFGLV